MRLALLLSCLAFGPAAFAAEARADLTLRIEPAAAYLERVADGQALNVDLVLVNRSDIALDIDRLQLSAYDAKGKLLLRRFVDGNGVRPSTGVLSARALPAGATVAVFQPFPPFAAELPVARVRFDLEASGPKGQPALQRSVEAATTTYRNGASFVLPLRGRMINYDGHDILGHHRRFDVHFAPIAAMGFSKNFMRYSYDLVTVDDAGEMSRGDVKDNASWFGFGAEVVAVADGTVVLARGDAPDNRQFDQGKLATDPMVLFGNVVVIDHGNGEFGVYAHAKQGSVRVAAGQAVRRGEVIAQVGASGSAFFPHLHFQLQDGPDTSSEGLPSYFDDFSRVIGNRRIARSQSTVDTGEIVESTVRD